MSTEPKSVEGVFRNGKIELAETPLDVDEARVIVTFLPNSAVNLSARGIDEAQAASLRSRLGAFTEDWDLPEMGAYDAL
ncbi:MAG TPA: hypothetical protein VGN90_07990 [Pyrinomonadaceae bacterium]|jgi:hypothetical protein|nr:hypothetical protein [Pyrinomonadaceae bacterium]